LIKSTIIPEESFQFPSKHILLKAESISEKEEQILRFLDQELPESEMEATRQWLTTDVSAQEFF
jgi:hypothetical protein